MLAVQPKKKNYIANSLSPESIFEFKTSKKYQKY